MSHANNDRSNNLLRRIRTRSGFLSYSETVDGVNDIAISERFRWAAELARPLAGERVADIGCWTGGLLSLLVEDSPQRIVGIDVSGPWLHVAERNVPDATFLKVENLVDLPDSLSEQFDCVFFLETLEHLPRGTEREVISSLASICSPEGKIILSTPVAGVAALLDPAWFLVGHRHYRLSTLRRLVSSTGLEVSGYYYSGNFWTSLDVVSLYVFKHILRRQYSSPTSLTVRSSTGICRSRRWDTATIWLELRRVAK